MAFPVRHPDGYLYHATLASKLPAIVRSGHLVPSTASHWEDRFGEYSIGKIFFGAAPDVALYYVKLLIRKNKKRWRGERAVVLRVPREDVANPQRDEYAEYAPMIGFAPGEGSVFTDRPVPLHRAEIRVAGGKWVPLAQAVPSGESLAARLRRLL